MMTDSARSHCQTVLWRTSFYFSDCFCNVDGFVRSNVTNGEIVKILLFSPDLAVSTLSDISILKIMILEMTRI